MLVRFFSYYTVIIPSRSHIWLLVAIFGDLAIINIFDKENGLAYSAETNQL